MACASRRTCSVPTPSRRHSGGRAGVGAGTRRRAENSGGLAHVPPPDMTPPAPQPAPAPQPTPPGLRTVQVTLTVAGRPLNVRVDVPTAPIPPAELLPFYRALVDSLVKASTKLGAGAGRSVSCRQGC